MGRSHLQGSFLQLGVLGLGIGEPGQQEAQEDLQVQQHPRPKVHVQAQRHLHQSRVGVCERLSPSSARQAACVLHQAWLCRAFFLAYSKACKEQQQQPPPRLAHAACVNLHAVSAATGNVNDPSEQL